MGRLHRHVGFAPGSDMRAMIWDERAALRNVTSGRPAAGLVRKVIPERAALRRQSCPR
jgi:hypothetical protein